MPKLCFSKVSVGLAVSLAAANANYFEIQLVPSTTLFFSNCHKRNFGMVVERFFLTVVTNSLGTKHMLLWGTTEAESIALHGDPKIVLTIRQRWGWSILLFQFNDTLSAIKELHLHHHVYYNSIRFVKFAQFLQGFPFPLDTWVPKINVRPFLDYHWNQSACPWGQLKWSPQAADS